MRIVTKITTRKEMEEADRMIDRIQGEIEDHKDDIRDLEREIEDLEKAIGDYLTNRQDKTLATQLLRHIEQTPGRFTWAEQEIVTKAVKDEELKGEEFYRFRLLAMQELHITES